MILHGLSSETLARLLSLDRPGWEDDSWLLFGPSAVFAVLPSVEEDEHEPLRWAAE